MVESFQNSKIPWSKNIFKTDIPFSISNLVQLETADSSSIHIHNRRYKRSWRGPVHNESALGPMLRCCSAQIYFLLILDALSDAMLSDGDLLYRCYPESILSAHDTSKVCCAVWLGGGFTLLNRGKDWEYPVYHVRSQSVSSQRLARCIGAWVIALEQSALPVKAVMMIVLSSDRWRSTPA